MQENIYLKWLDTLTPQRVSCSGIATMAYHTTLDRNKRTLLLMHGLSGDRHGLAAFGYALVDDYNLVLVELPGHGQTELPEADTAEHLAAWARELLPSLSSIQIKIDGVIAHSMGGYAAQFIRQVPIMLYNPVLRTSAIASLFQRQMRALGRIAGRVHSWYPWAAYRGYRLLSVPTEQNKALIRWISRSVKITQRQYRYGMNLVVVTRNGELIAEELSAIKQLAIVVGCRDKLVVTRLEPYSTVAPHAMLYQLDLGHLSIIEDPAATSLVAKKFFEGLR